MTDKQKLKDTTKKMIRATLTPAPRGMKAREFLRQYKMDALTPLPYRELGYPTPEEFYRDIPDVVHIRWEAGEMVLSAVPDENTRHLSRMVANQRTKSKTSQRAKTPHGLYGAGNTRRGPPRHRPRPVMNVNPTVPAFLRGKIRELLFAYPAGILGLNFEMAFSRRFGQKLNHNRLGFNTQLDLLKSIDDIVQLELLSTGGYKLHGRDLSRSHKGTDGPLLERPERREHRPVVKPLSAYGIDDEEGSVESCDGFIFDDFNDDSSVKPELKKQIQDVLASKPKGIWAARFQAEFQGVTGKELPLKDTGYISVIELMSTLPDIVSIERPTPRDWLLSDARIKKSEPSPPSVFPDTRSQEELRPPLSTASSELLLSTTPPVSVLFKETMRQVLQHSMTGVPLEHLLSTFKALTGKTLNCNELGFAALDELLLEIPDVVTFHYQGEGQIILRAVSNGESPRTDLLFQAPRHVNTIPKEVAQKRGVAADAVGPGASYTPMKLPTDQINQYVSVFVSNVITPANFCLQLKGPYTTEALELLMDELETLYEGPNSEEYNMPSSLVTVGQIGAALFPEDSNWHRVTITGIRNMEFVDVYYVDYGGSCAVPKKQLKLLRNRFLKLPAMAIPAKLANIYPVGPEWSRIARDAMLNMCSNKALLALVMDFINEAVMLVCLCDTNGEEDLHVNDTLVQRGYATFEAPKTTPRAAAQMVAQDDPAVQRVIYGGIMMEQPTRTESISRSESSESLQSLPDSTPADNRSQASQGTSVESEGAAMPTLECASTATTSSSSDGDLNGLNKVRYTRFVQLTPEYSFHIVKYGDKGYVVNSEVSALLWRKNLLRSMLRQKKHNIPNLVLPQIENRELFEEFLQTGIEGTLDGDTVKSHVTLYDLQSTLEILDIFNHPSDALISAVNLEVIRFNPNDPYWKGVDVAPEDTVSDSALSKLVAKLENLQVKRKELLQTMAVHHSHSAEKVEDLVEIENNILKIRQQVQNPSTITPDLISDGPNSQRQGQDIPKSSQGTVEQASGSVNSTTAAAVAPSPAYKSVNTVAPMPATPVKDSTSTAASSYPTGFPSTTQAHYGSLMNQGAQSGGVPVPGGQTLGLATPGGQGLLSADQQQLLMSYQMLLSQSNSLGMPGLVPGFTGMPQAMVQPSLNPLYLQQAAMATQMTPLMGSHPMIDFRALSASLNTSVPNATMPTLSQSGLPSYGALGEQGRGLGGGNNMPHPGCPQGKPQ